MGERPDQESEAARQAADMGERANVPRPTDVRDRAALTALVAEGAQVKWLMFWGHQPQADGSVGSGCLSQWYPSPFTVDGVSYPTAEHWMMTAKARLFGDDAMADRIPAVATPAEAKKLGRLVRGFDDTTWDAHRFDLVVDGNVAKFSSTPALRDYLLGTRSRVLVEASPRDRIWGIGLSASHVDAADPARWRGRNLLGFALMEARARLAA